MFTPFVTLSLIAAGLIVAVSSIVAAASRHRKQAEGELSLVGARARVEVALRPEGAVIVGGEVWRARAVGGAEVGRGCYVRVVGASTHLLEVEPLP